MKGVRLGFRAFIKGARVRLKDEFEYVWESGLVDSIDLLLVGLFLRG